MRKVLVALNLLVAVASAALFVYTFFAREHLLGRAEEYVIAKTVVQVTPAVELVEAGLNNRAAQFVPADTRAAVQAEVDSFRRDPHKYVRALVAKGAAVEKPKHPLAERVLAWKEQARAYFEKTFAGLVLDLRIFAGTNVVAALLAALLAWRARGRLRWHVFGVSVLLLFALSLQAYLFIDGLTFFRVITNARVGWSYPGVVALTFGYLYWNYGRFVPLAPPAANPSGTQKSGAVR